MLSFFVSTTHLSSASIAAFMYDAVIIGGGPAGASCAESLAKKGFSCLLLEKGGRKRYKPCAGGISFEAARLKPVPPSIVEREIVKIRVYSLSSEVQVNVADGPGYTVYRTEYDQWLRDEAEDRGASIIYNEKARKIALKNGIVKGSKEYKGNVLVGAFGVSPMLYRQFNVIIPGVVELLQQEYALPEGTVSERIGDCLEIYFDKKYAPYGYSWIFPKKEGVSAGIMSLPHAASKMERLKSFVSHQENLRGVTPKKFYKRHTFGSIILQRPVDRTCGESFVLVGDAAGFCDPLTYEGISNAIKSGRIAADAIEEHLECGTPLSSYEDRWRTLMYEDDIYYAQKLQTLMYGHSLSDLLVDAVVSLAGEDKDVATGFRWFFSKERPRKTMYDIIMRRKWKICKKVGISSLKLIPRLIPRT